MKRAIVSVINDLATDQRVHRTAVTLQETGYAVTVVGRRLSGSLEIKDRPYATRRFRLLRNKGPLFYAAFNLRLCWYLLFKRADLLWANDLDTLLPNFLVSKLKGIPLVYDSHEYFTEVPELQHRPAVKKTWLAIERFIFPKLEHVITVNDSIAALYKETYGKDVTVIRNVPFSQEPPAPVDRKTLGIPPGNSVIIFQGSGINVHRGAEEVLAAMQYVEGATLMFVGGGDVIGKLKSETQRLGFGDRVLFVPRQAPEMLRSYTACADIGLTLDKNTNINYRFSLPNKLFDYIHAGVPVLASNLEEVRNIVETYDVGMIVDSHDPKDLASAIRSMLDDKGRLLKWKENLKIAARQLCWENEKAYMIRLVHAL